MFFTLQNPYHDREITKAAVIYRATRNILAYKFSTSEILLDRLFRETYDRQLRRVCLTLIHNIAINFNDTNESIITFKTKELDQLASLITYGNEKVPGSSILKYAFLN